MKKMIAAAAAALTLAAAGSASAATFVLPEKASSLFFVENTPYGMPIDVSAGWNRSFNVGIDGVPGFETIGDYGYGAGRTCTIGGGNCEWREYAFGSDNILLSIGWTSEGMLLRVRTELNPFAFCETGSFASTCEIQYKPTYLNIGGDAVLLSTSAIPEPATWAMMIAGFGLAGAYLRRNRNKELLQSIA